MDTIKVRAYWPWDLDKIVKQHIEWRTSGPIKVVWDWSLLAFVGERTLVRKSYKSHDLLILAIKRNFIF